MVANPPMTPVRTTPEARKGMWLTAKATPPFVRPARTQGINPSRMSFQRPTIQSMPKPIRMEMIGRNWAKTWADFTRDVPVRSE